MKYLIQCESRDDFFHIYQWASRHRILSNSVTVDNGFVEVTYHFCKNNHPQESVVINLDLDTPNIGFCNERYYFYSAPNLYLNHIRMSGPEFLRGIDPATDEIINTNQPQTEQIRPEEPIMPGDLKFKVGADPEFNIVMQNKKVSACSLIPMLLKGNHSKGNMGYEVGDAGCIGWDGASSTGEIRPNANKNIDKVVENIGKLFKAFAKRSQLFDLSTLSNAGSVGGHIHLEIPNDSCFIDGSKLKKAEKMLSSFYIPLMMGENPKNLKLRTSHNYGRIDNDSYRTANRDNKIVLEFRVPSAEWITTPKIAKATLAYVATVWNEILYHTDNFKNFKNIIFANIDQGRAIQDLTMSNYVFVTKSILKEVRNAVRTFELYPQFEKEIEYALNHMKVIKDKENVGYNILKGWELLDSPMPTKKDLSNEKKMKSILKDKDMDAFQDLITFTRTDDHNMAEFINSLKSKVAAFNWRMNNKYAFFGARKGLDFIVARINSKGETELYLGKDQIKTCGDALAVQELIGRIATRLFPRHLNTKEKDNEIIVGIPYADRAGMNTKPFLDLIHEMEKGTLIPELLVTSNFTGDLGGKVEAIMKDSNINNNPVFSNDPPLQDLEYPYQEEDENEEEPVFKCVE